MVSKGVRNGLSKLGKGENIGEVVMNQEEKIEIEFRVLKRVYARDFVAIKKSFEEWSRLWK